MTHKTPIPTDNVYKFYALFGLALLFACVYGFISIYTSNLDSTFEIYQELEILKGEVQPTNAQKIRIEVLERQSELGPKNKDFYINVITIVSSFCVFLMAFGFYQWQYKIQPMQDELVARQLEKLELEIKAIKRQTNYVRKRPRNR